MRLKNFAVLILTIPLMLGIVSCSRTKKDNDYNLVFKALKDGEVFIHGSVIIENEAGKFSTVALNEYGVSVFRVRTSETKFWIGVVSGELFFFFGLLDVSNIEIQNGMRLVVLDISIPTPESIPNLQKKPDKKIWT